MSNLVSETVQRARKPHHCEECLQPIDVGQNYQRQFFVDGGDAWAWKAHIDCSKVSWEIFFDADLHHGDEWVGFGQASAECGDWLKSVARFLRRKPEYADVRLRMIRTRLRWRKERQDWEREVEARRASRADA